MPFKANYSNGAQVHVTARVPKSTIRILEKHGVSVKEAIINYANYLELKENDKKCPEN